MPITRRRRQHHPADRERRGGSCHAAEIAEFWAVATRSSAQNGLGLPVAVIAAALDHIERVFAVLPDHPAIYDHWKRLVVTHDVIGNQVYDARLVAAMTAHGVGRILTFDAGDFARYGIEVIHPSAVS